MRWLWSGVEQFRQHLAEQIAPDDWGQIDTSALPVTHPSRVRGPNSWVGPNGLVAGFGRDGAHAEWFYGLRLAVLTDLGSRVVRAWSIVPAAVNERQVGIDLVDGSPGWPGCYAIKASTANIRRRAGRARHHGADPTDEA